MVMDKFKSPFIFIILITFFSHGLLLLNDGIYWDAWGTHFYLEDPSFIELMQFTREAGLPETAYIHRFINIFPDRVFAYKFFTFFLILSATTLIFKLASYFTSKNTALKLACVSAVYPAFQVAIMSSMMQYMLDYVLFLCGVWLTLTFSTTPSADKTRLKRFFLRILALLTFTLAFTLNSLLAYYSGLIIIIFIVFRHIDKKKSGIVFVIKYIDFLILPIAYWYFKNLFFPAYGAYAVYNHFIFSKEIMLWVTSVFLTSSILRPFQYTIPLYLLIPSVSIGIFLILKYCNNIDSNDRNKIKPLIPIKPINQLIYGGILLIFGTLPYIVVGKPPHPDSMDTRNAILVALPMSIIIVAILEIMLSSFSQTLILYLLLFTFTLQSFQNYVNWQARWVKDRSIIFNIKSQPILQQSSVIWIEDDHYHIEGTDWFYTSDWWGISRAAFGDERHAIVGRPYVNSEIAIPTTGFSARSLTSNVDGLGCKAKVSIFKGDRQHENLNLAFRYWYYRFLAPAQMEKFLTPITYLRVTPLPMSNAINCKSW